MFLFQCLIQGRPSPGSCFCWVHSVVGKTEKSDYNRSGSGHMQTWRYLKIVQRIVWPPRRTRAGRQGELLQWESLLGGFWRVSWSLPVTERQREFQGRASSMCKITAGERGSRSSAIVKWAEENTGTWGWEVRQDSLGRISDAILGLGIFEVIDIPWRVDIIRFVWLHFNNIFSIIKHIKCM